MTSETDGPRSGARAPGAGVAALAAGLALAGCTESPTGGGLPAPEAGSVYVFFPSSGDGTVGLVRGRGLPGAAPAGATRVSVEAYPSNTSASEAVAADGSFEFQIVAISGDVLEIRAEREGQLGAPLFVRVPPGIPPRVAYVCCTNTNACVREDVFEVEMTCPPEPPIGAVRCEIDADCGIAADEVLPIDVERVSITPPNARGDVVIEGRLVPNTLVTVRNRGKFAVGAHLPEDERRRRGLEDPVVEERRIADDRGRFRFERFAAIADDELIFRIEDLNGFRSPLYATRVPDPPLAGVDVLGVVPWRPLTNGERGTVAIRIAPYGTDGRGLCPDNPNPEDGLELCVGGGLDHDMIAGFRRATIDFGRQGQGTPLAPEPTRPSEDIPYVRGLEGNVRSGRLDVFVVVDMSAAAADVDPDGIAFDALRSFVRHLRGRDRVGIVSFGDRTGVRTGLSADRQAVDAVLTGMASETRSGPTNVFEGALLAAEALERRDGGLPGRIVVVTHGLPEGSGEEARAQLDRVIDVVERQAAGFASTFEIDVVGVDLPERGPTLLELENLAEFTRGFLESAPTPNDLERTLADLRGRQVGSFILLYDVSIPETAGKAGTVRLDFDVQIGAETAPATYEGPLFIANAPNP